MSYAIGFADIESAALRIDGTAHRTPVISSRQLDEVCGSKIFLKCENLQRVGAFKFRGAFNAVMSLPRHISANGVVTHSSGNHGQALAAAAQVCGVPAYIVMPENAPTVKVRAVRTYGGEITFCESTLKAREATAATIQKNTGAQLVHPYNDAQVMAGQGTVAIEFLGQTPELDALIVPVGGGGLLSGTCVAAKTLQPNLRVFGAEPAGADDAARSLTSGHIQPMMAPNTVADGLRTSLGADTWPIIRDYVEDIVTVDDQKTIDAMRFVWERMKLVIEPSAAVSVAAAIAICGSTLSGKKVGLIVTGGNVDLDNLPW